MYSVAMRYSVEDKTRETKDQWLPGSGEKGRRAGGASGTFGPGKVLYDPVIRILVIALSLRLTELPPVGNCRV